MTTLIDEQPEFQYGMSSAQQYAWIKEHRPEVWERVKAAVAAGRFLPLGGMWVESDTVMPTGESLVRQFSHGQRFFEREFGIRSKGVWLPDSFGYSPALPQLMRRAGFEWFFTQKISWNQQNVFPHHSFLWEGIDGSQVFTHFPSMDTYNSQLSGMEVAKASRQFKENRLSSRSIAPVGWGDGGGGTTREMTGKAERLRDLEGSAQVVWEHPDVFFDAAKAELPHPAVWVGELYLELHRGTLTSQHATKALHRWAEHALIEAELWAATDAVRTGAAYPQAEFDRLWQAVLLHEFHDILPGTSIAWVHREAVSVLSDVLSDAEDISLAARRSLAGEGDRELQFEPTSVGRGRALGAAFVAEPTAAPVSLTEENGGWRLENELVSVLVSAEGLIVSAIDKASGREAVAEGKAANLFQLHQDFRTCGTRGTSTGTTATASTTSPRSRRSKRRWSAGPRGSWSCVRSRSPRSSRRSSSTPSRAPCCCATRSTGTRPRSCSSSRSRSTSRPAHTDAETQFGYQSRVTHTNTSWEAAKFETSMHRFVLVREQDFGVALVNDSIYGYDTSREVSDDAVTTTVRLSLLRAPRFPDPDTDHGHHEIEVGFVIGADAAVATAEGIRINALPSVVRGAREVEPLVSVQGDGIVVSAVKLADDGSGDVIVRVYEALGRRAVGELAVGFEHREVARGEPDRDDIDDARVGGELQLRPFEVRTLRIVR